MKKLIWLGWLALTVVIAGYLLYTLLYADNKSEYLIGETTYGHYQIELECSACHTKSFSDRDAIQEACTGCHAADLKEAHDSHPKKKFTDPREAYRLEKLDGRYCISCHTEHRADQTHAMGVTLPDDYCFHCHKDIGKDRPSHKGLPFDSCASAGCHNFHDNRALYEDFLLANARQPWLLAIAKLSKPNAAEKLARQYIRPEPAAFEEQKTKHPKATAEWLISSHGKAGVGCGGCHAEAENPQTWIEKPGIEQCSSCHSYEAERFTQGKHGMRIASKAAVYDGAIRPQDARLQFKDKAMDVQHGCNSCHGAHLFDTTAAATESCLGCHADQHSLAFLQSPHGQGWQKMLASGQDEAAVPAVSCATCHMPTVTMKQAGEEVVYVDHNQNHNLRPNEKMIRSVCMNCHGLGFSIDALADPELIKNNFNGKPGTHIESIDWALKRLK